MKVIGIDPGLNNIGWAILTKDKKGNPIYINSGIIKTTNKQSLPARLALIFNSLDKIIEQNEVDFAAIEEVFINMNAKSSMALSFARGAILTLIGYKNLEAKEYAPNKIKKTLSGNGKADKSQIEKMISLIIPEAKFSTKDEADAIAIAYTGLVLGDLS